VLLAFVAPSALFFLLWGPAERGGYFLGCAPFAAALAALGMPTSRRSARIALLCGALLQGAYAAVEVRRFDDPSWERYQEERAAAVQSARASRPDSARVVLFSFDEHRQPIETRLPDAMEHNLLPLLKAPEAAALSVDALVAGLAGQVAEVLRDPRTLLLVDLGGWEGVPSLKEQRSTDFPAAFERHLRDTYRTREAAVGSGLLLTVELPSAESLPR
jgi:hypothetical protein